MISKHYILIGRYNMEKIKIGLVSLGCTKNHIDAEHLLCLLDNDGYEITAEETEADVVIINTCAFIESAKQESIDNILDIAWLKKNANLKKIVVTGCLAERYRDDILSEMPEVDAVVGIGSNEEICRIIEDVMTDKRVSSYGEKENLNISGGRILTSTPHSAYIKIAEGCDNRCTYCAIPLIRGTFRSRTIEDIVEEAVNLEKDGAVEISLIAQDTSRYGEDLYGEYSLAKLIRSITESTDRVYLRLLYCYPDKITDELISEIKNNDRVLKYLDLPIQHINDDILKAMNRHGDSELIKAVIAKLRKEIPEIVLRTTVIVGFPGESEEAFEELCDFVKEIKFERLGAFTYSREEDTAAYSFDGQVDEQTKQDRYDGIMELSTRINEEYNEKKIGETYTVLCESYDAVPECFVGRTYADAPDIDCKVFFDVGMKRAAHADGELIKVKITDFSGYDLIGESID